MGPECHKVKWIIKFKFQSDSRLFLLLGLPRSYKVILKFTHVFECAKKVNLMNINDGITFTLASKFA